MVSQIHNIHIYSWYSWYSWHIHDVFIIFMIYSWCIHDIHGLNNLLYPLIFPHFSSFLWVASPPDSPNIFGSWLHPWLQVASSDVQWCSVMSRWMRSSPPCAMISPRSRPTWRNPRPNWPWTPITRLFWHIFWEWEDDGKNHEKNSGKKTLKRWWDLMNGWCFGSSFFTDSLSKKC